MLSEEEIKNPAGWLFIQEKREGSTLIKAQSPNMDIYESVTTALFNELALQMYVTVTNNSTGVSVVYDATYRWVGKESWQDDQFIKDKTDSISFWAIQNRLSPELAKAIWLRSYEEFADALIRASYYAIEVRHEREKGEQGGQGNLF